MIRAVIFDFNGVLVDDEPVHFELFREVLAQEGVDDDRAASTTSAISATTTAAASRPPCATPGRTADRDRVDDLIARKAGRYVEVGRDRACGSSPARPRAWPRWPARWPLAICSGALRPEIEFALDRLGRRDRVVAIVSAEDTTRCKPDPAGLPARPGRPARAGRTRTWPTSRPDECLVVEDSLAGIVSAKGAGMWAVGIAHTYEPTELRQAGADAVLARPRRPVTPAGSSGHSPPCGGGRSAMSDAMSPRPDAGRRRRPGLLLSRDLIFTSKVTGTARRWATA